MPTSYEVTATALNLRSAPSTASTILAVLRRGQTCIGSGPAADGWLPVSYDQQSGYVWASYVQGGSSTGAGETAPPSPLLAPSNDQALPGDPQTRLRAINQLHPSFRAALDQLLQLTAAGGHPFRVFEAFRTPERQKWLFDQGRTRPGSIVTKARPWESFHQFGLGADLVLFVDGQWTWSDAGPLAAHWKQLPILAKQCGLRTLNWEAPHVEWPIDLKDALSQQLLTTGDEDWLDTISAAATRWRRSGETTGPELKPAERPEL